MLPYWKNSKLLAGLIRYYNLIKKYRTVYATNKFQKILQIPFSLYIIKQNGNISVDNALKGVIMSIFYKNKFFPQNFILLSDDEESLDDQIEQICSEAFRISPDSFNGECLYFKFIFRYCLPYEQNRFHELKRFQETARSNIRFKDEYRGYIVIDITEWKGHLTEELFSDITLPFLSDMSDIWKYIFISPGNKLTEDEIEVLLRYFKVKRLDKASFAECDLYKCFFEDLREKHDIHFLTQTENLFRRFIPQNAIKTKRTVIAIENDLKSFFGTHITVRPEMMAKYFKNPDGFCFDLISEKDMEKIQRISKEEITL